MGFCRDKALPEPRAGWPRRRALARTEDGTFEHSVQLLDAGMRPDAETADRTAIPVAQRYGCPDAKDLAGAFQ